MQEETRRSLFFGGRMFQSVGAPYVLVKVGVISIDSMDIYRKIQLWQVGHMCYRAVPSR